MTKRIARQEAQATFRRFAWTLAGQLAERSTREPRRNADPKPGARR